MQRKWHFPSSPQVLVTKKISSSCTASSLRKCLFEKRLSRKTVAAAAAAGRAERADVRAVPFVRRAAVPRQPGPAGGAGAAAAGAALLPVHAADIPATGNLAKGNAYID